ncbi:MAG: hypothetical protein M0006_15960 [Magnetospirillum sp.]|nr:hypothetical protein [Magnetospirillum sp.]
MTKEKRTFDFDLPDAGSALLPPRMARPAPAEEMKAVSGQLLGEAHAAGTLTTQVLPTRPESSGPNRRTVWIGDHIWNALGERALREGRTRTYYVLLGLQQLGFPVSEGDLEDKRGSFLKEAARERRALKEC